MTTNLKDCPLDALDRIDETIGLIRGLLNDPPELVAMNVESMKADFDCILKDLRKYGVVWRGNALIAQSDPDNIKWRAKYIEQNKVVKKLKKALSDISNSYGKMIYGKTDNRGLTSRMRKIAREALK